MYAYATTPTNLPIKIPMPKHLGRLFSETQLLKSWRWQAAWLQACVCIWGMACLTDRQPGAVSGKELLASITEQKRTWQPQADYGFMANIKTVIQIAFYDSNKQLAPMCGINILQDNCENSSASQGMTTVALVVACVILRR